MISSNGFSKKQLSFFSKAEALASSSEFSIYHVGCVAVLNNQVVATGVNSYKTHPLQYKYNKFRNFNCLSDPKNMHSTHAEVSCLSQILQLSHTQVVNFSKLELYIFRKLKTQPFGLSRPCPACFHLIKDLGVHHVYYTTNYGFAYEFIS